jgi:hypothetical protein
MCPRILPEIWVAEVSEETVVSGHKQPTIHEADKLFEAGPDCELTEIEDDATPRV